MQETWWIRQRAFEFHRPRLRLLSLRSLIEPLAWLRRGRQLENLSGQG
jgi:hypothetical protein